MPSVYSCTLCDTTVLLCHRHNNTVVSQSACAHRLRGDGCAYRHHGDVCVRLPTRGCCLLPAARDCQLRVHHGCLLAARDCLPRTAGSSEI
jgi:hypothetical protein|eukprot:COSAG01_NODE_10499_length_2151_cov_1.442008_1_plen_91_part_00